jgi:hypothetical protein
MKKTLGNRRERLPEVTAQKAAARRVPLPPRQKAGCPASRDSIPRACRCGHGIPHRDPMGRTENHVLKELPQ